MTSIFISSTYCDLIPHRKAVIEAIRSAGMQPIEMESFNARSKEPQTVCFEEIAEADIFVGIYAHRYGYVPDGASLSITQREYEYARDWGKPILCYEVAKHHPWAPDMISVGEGKKSLDSFKEIIRKKYVVQEFTSPENLAAKVVAGIARYLEELNQQHKGQRIILNAGTGMDDVLKVFGVDPVALYAAQAEHLRIHGKLQRGNTVRAGELRTWLLRYGGRHLVEPARVTVQGVLQPYVLMHSGWWEEGKDSQKYPVRGLQEWLFHGLQEWAPSWGYA